MVDAAGTTEMDGAITTTGGASTAIAETAEEAMEIIAADTTIAETTAAVEVGTATSQHHPYRPLQARSLGLPQPTASSFLLRLPVGSLLQG